MDNIIKLYENSFREHAAKIALTDYFSGTQLTYLELARTIAQFHLLLNGANIKRGDKIAIIGKNSPQWVTVYIGVITYGAVAVPILPDFGAADLANLIVHSDARLLFADDKIWNRIKESQADLGLLEGVVSLDNNEVLYKMGSNALSWSKNTLSKRFAKLYPQEFSVDDIVYRPVADDDLMIISYTSGTSGFSKGVMLTVGNITANVRFALDHKFHFVGSRVLALLPLAHAYGCAFDMLTPLATGSHITLLGRTPTPTVLVEAMQKVKPHLICTVPLVLEKIVCKKIFPMLQRKPMKIMMHTPLLRNILRLRIRKALLATFGGCCAEVNTGGAALNPDVEAFLMSIKFPFTVGYGMTECAPLVSYERHENYKAGTCGRLLPGMDARIDSPDPTTGIGEICVRGANVMKGYYKNPQATAEAFDNEGWLHTGDMGILSNDGTLSIKGRCKDMILSSNGQNIYPEAIESKLNSMPLVVESLICEEKGKLVALVVPDWTEINSKGLRHLDLASIMDRNLQRLNSLVAAYERVSGYKICESEFEKTPKRSIRRNLYPEAAKFVKVA